MALQMPRTVRRRTSVKQDRIVAALRGDIIGGTFKPGSQLPNQFELVDRFKVSTITIQRALERLARDGFIVTQPRQGVFVREHPPHLADYYFVFPHDAVDMAQTNRFLFSLSQIASGMSSRGNKRSAVYYGIEKPNQTPAYQELVKQVEAHRTAGLIFLTHPGFFVGTPLLDEPGIPRVAIMSMTIPGITAVRVGGYRQEAMTWLAESGSRRLAMICVPQMTEEQVGLWASDAEAHGMTMPRPSVISVPVQHPHWARHAIETLMDRPPEARPNGLIITDDNLVPQATAGLLALGIRVPQDCRVVAHGNFPWATECLVPAKRFGPDTRQVLQACIDAIDLARRGGEVPQVVTVPSIEGK
jgi:DNA-binding transcriptional regulator YhcF (GntR family)/DNA-binding LacI/PurR family transcriptional regulator